MKTHFRRLLHLLRWSRYEADLRAEIEAHRALRQDAFERDGLAPDAAAHASQRALGNVALAVDDTRDVWAIRTVDSLRQDVRAALRGVAQEPRLCVGGDRHARPRHRRQHGAVFDFQQPDPAPAARAPSRQPGVAHQRELVLSDSEEVRARETELFDGAFAWSTDRFDLSPSGQRPRGRGDVSGRLFDVTWRHRHTRPDVSRLRRRAAPRPRALSPSSVIVSGSNGSPAQAISSGGSSPCSVCRSRLSA